MRQNKCKTFFTLVYYEMKKILRSKIVFVLLAIGPIAIAFLLSTVQPMSSYSIAVFRDGLSESEMPILSLTEDGKNKLTEVSTEEEGYELLNRGDVFFFLSVDAETDPISATIYFDKSNMSTSNIITRLQKDQAEQEHEALISFLSDYGITIDESYFNLLTFEALEGTELSYKQNVFPMMTSALIAIALMLGLAYSMSRDGETGVKRQLSYTPIGANLYLFSKAAPYFLLGMIQSIAFLLVGIWFFQITYVVNFGILLAIMMLFCLSNLSLGLLVSGIKNQTASSMLSILTIVLPVFALSFSFLQSFPVAVQVFLYLLPTTPFLLLFKYLAINGTFLWTNFIILVMQMVVYYLAAMLLLKRQSGK